MKTLILKMLWISMKKLKSHYKDLKWGLLTGRMVSEEKPIGYGFFFKRGDTGFGFHYSD